EVYVILDEGPDLQALLTTNERLAGELGRTLADVPMQAPTVLLPSDATQARRADIVRSAGMSATAINASLSRAAEDAGFRPESFDPFRQRVPRLLDAAQRLTVDDYKAHGLGSLVDRFVAKTPNGWRIASYVFPA